METYTLGMHRAADNLAVAKRENEVILYEKDYKQRYQGFDPNSSESYIMFEFIQDKNMAQSVELAKFIQRRTCAQAGRINKGVKQAGFLVLRETSMPSCLVELGFISTSDEERFLHSQNGVSQMGQGIYQAFLDYKRKYAPTTTTPYRVEAKQEVNIPSVVPQQEVVKESKREKRRREKAEQEAREAAEKAAREQQEAAEKAAREAVEKQQPQDTVATVQQPVPVVTPKQPVPVATPQQTEVKQPAPVAAAPVASAPVFKVQILASSVKLKSTSPQLKGQSDAECYQEGGMYKYTVGASTNYNEIFRLRKELLDKFPQAFIIAFKDGQKMDVRQAIQEFKNRK
jgi:N-acetylmuramoyl-L-alanine amidase